MARQEKLYHYIYKITNVLNNKYYIGMHSTDDLEDGYLGSGSKLSKSKKRYGIQNFKKEILEFLPNRTSLKEKENQLVNENLLKDPLCMNLMQGGHGGWAGNKNSLIPLLKQAIKFSKKIKEDSIFRKNYQNKISSQLKKNWKDGKYTIRFGKENGFYDKHHTEETKQLMCEKAHLRTGNKNSQFGTCWITNGKENRKVKKENLVLEKDWFLGKILQTRPIN